LVGATLSGFAAADPADQARFYDSEARKHFGNGNYQAALDDFFAAQALTPSATLAFNIATCFEQLREYRAAYTYFAESLETQGLPESFRQAAQSSLEKLAPRVARIHVETEPPGLFVYVDDEAHGHYGKTPRDVAIDPGKHRVWVSAPGYLPAEKEIDAKVGELVEVELKARMITGRVSLKGELPSGVSGPVSVKVLSHEGDLIAEGPLPFDQAVPPDGYRVVIVGGGLQPWSTSAVVLADKTVELTAQLNLMPKPTGDISAVSSVAGSIVELDGVQMGTAPLVIPNVVVGDHELVIAGPSGPPVSATIPVEQQRRTWATATYDLRRTVSPATYWVGGAGLLALGVGTSLLVTSYGMYDRGDLSGKDYQDAAVATLIGGGITLAAAGIVYLATGKQAPVSGQLTFRKPE
jgi:hypothetical protein